MVKKKVKALILAAGRGSRMGHLTENFQKCLLPVNGKSLLETNIEKLLYVGVDECIILVNYRVQDVQESLLKSGLDKVCKLVYTNQISTGKSLNLISDLGYLGDYFFMSHGDIIFPRDDLLRMVEVYHSIKEKNPLASVVGTVPLKMGLTHVTVKRYGDGNLEILDCESYNRNQQIDPNSDAYCCGLEIINLKSFDFSSLRSLDKPMIEAGLVKPSKYNLVFEFRMSNKFRHIETADDYKRITG